MTDFNHIKRRLSNLVENRNYFFRNTPKIDAEKYLANKINFIGMTNSEIENIENQIGNTFPIDFRQYLLEFGKNCGELFCNGEDLEPSNIVEYQKWARELEKEQNSDSFLTPNSIVFFFHQGYSFYYFEKVDDDYLVYLYVEGDSKPTKKFESFSEMLENELSLMEEINKRGQESDGHFMTIYEGSEHIEFPAKSSGVIPRKVGDKFRF